MAESNSTITAAPSLKLSDGSNAIFACFATIAAVVLLIILYLPLFIPVEASWRTDPNYSHGYLIPVICVWLTWRALQRAGPMPDGGEGRFGLISIIAGMSFLMAATVIPWPIITFAALALTLRGIAIALGGRAWASYFATPILFAFFMFPVPVSWTTYLALWLQDVVSRISAGVMDPFVICWRTGTVLHFVGVSQALNVGEECSGLRQLVSFLALAVLLGILLDRPTWSRVLLACLAIPAAVFANVLRVVLMCFGAIHFGTEWMNGWLHYAPAAFTLPVGFGLLAAADYLLSKLTADQSASNLIRRHGSTVGLGRGEPLWSRLRVVVLGLLVGLVAQVALKIHLQRFGSQSFPSASGSLSELPLALPGEWTGINSSDTEGLRQGLPYAADDILLRNYHWKGGGVPAQVYIVYSRVGDDRKHHPEICIREVTGAPEDLSGRARVNMDAEGRRAAQRFVFRTAGGRQTAVYYWHYTFFAPSSGASFLQTLHQRLGQNPPSVTAQVSVSYYESDDLQRIEQTLLPSLDRALTAGFVPTSAVIDSTRLNVALLRE